MQDKYDAVIDKLKVTWLRLLKAEAKRKTRKVAKLEAKIIALELKLKNEV